MCANAITFCARPRSRCVRNNALPAPNDRRTLASSALTLAARAPSTHLRPALAVVAFPPFALVLLSTADPSSGKEVCLPIHQSAGVLPPVRTEERRRQERASGLGRQRHGVRAQRHAWLYYPLAFSTHPQQGDAFVAPGCSAPAACVMPTSWTLVFLPRTSGVGRRPGRTRPPRRGPRRRPTCTRTGPRPWRRRGRT